LSKRRSTPTRKIPRPTKRRSQVRADGSYDKIVDFGYLSFLLAANFYGESWLDARDSYRDALLCGESWTLRKEIFPGYKAGRKVKRDGDAEKEATYQRVRDFRDYMRTDNTVHLVEHEGAEADDLVVALSYRFPGIPIIGVDKDLTSSPGVWNRMITHKGEKPNPIWKKLPKYQANCKIAPWSLYLRQALIGDKSDSIPRLLPSNGAQAIWYDAYNPKQPLRSIMNFYDIYKEDLILNLQLVLIPTPLLMDNQFPTLESWFNSMIDGSYWLGNYFDGFCDRAMASMDQMGSDDSWDRFSQ